MFREKQTIRQIYLKIVLKKNNKDIFFENVPSKELK